MTITYSMYIFIYLFIFQLSECLSHATYINNWIVSPFPLIKNDPTLEHRKSKLSYGFYSRRMREYYFKNAKMKEKLKLGRKEELGILDSSLWQNIFVLFRARGRLKNVWPPKKVGGLEIRQLHWEQATKPLIYYKYISLAIHSNTQF
jgi:hypothetical protein